MADGIDWGLLRPVDTGAAVQQGFATGMALVKHVQTQNALRSYLDNPGDERAYNALAAYDPQAAATIQQQELLRRKLHQQDLEQEQRRTIGAQAASGDVAGARTAALSAGNFDLLDHIEKLDDASRKRTADFWTAAGPVAYRLKQEHDPAKRQALWEQAKPILAATAGSTEMLDKFDPTNDTQLDAAITTSQSVKDLIEQGKITWHQQGEQPSFATDSMGRPVGAANPYANGGHQPTAAKSDYYSGDGGLSAAQAWQFIAPHEGGYAAHDGNGAPVNFGINQGANPDIDVSKLTAPKAQQLFEERYWKPSGAANLPAPLAAVHADTYFINPKKAGQFLAASEGDPQRYMDLREAWLNEQASHPSHARFAKAWANRNHDLREFAAEVSGGQGASSAVPTVSSKAELDALPTGTIYMAPDGSRRRKS